MSNPDFLELLSDYLTSPTGDWGWEGEGWEHGVEGTYLKYSGRKCSLLSQTKRGKACGCFPEASATSQRTKSTRHSSSGWQEVLGRKQRQ